MLLALRFEPSRFFLKGKVAYIHKHTVSEEVNHWNLKTKLTPLVQFEHPSFWRKNERMNINWNKSISSSLNKLIQPVNQTAQTDEYEKTFTSQLLLRRSSLQCPLSRN